MKRDSQIANLLDEAVKLLDTPVVGGRLDYMCQFCGGDDENFGGNVMVVHKKDCAWVGFMAKVAKL